MLKKVVRYVIAVIFAVTGLIIMEYIFPQLTELLGYDLNNNGVVGIVIAHLASFVVGLMGFGILGWLLSPFVISRSLRYTEVVAGVLGNVPTADILVMLLGIGIGLILANLLGSPFSHLPIVGSYIPPVLSMIFAVVGAKVALLKHKDIVGFFSRMPLLLKSVSKTSGAGKTGSLEKQYSKSKLLDTSVIIDGRIADIQKTGFLEGLLVVPHFVLDELQRLSDSADGIKRAKGRRGLDLIHAMQQDNKQLVVEDLDFEDIPEVDAKLVKLAKQLDAMVVTNDFNLNKVAEIQGIPVLNINDLANAVKPVVIPGEEMKVFLVKDGKEAGQAVAYLDDGTMIVVEGGRKHVGETMGVAVTSVLQTSAGRMIFAKVK